MTRLISLLILALLLLPAPPAHAGTVAATDGTGTWQSTKCTPPKTPAELAKDPETAANDLNAQMALHNQYVGQAEAYMNCVSQEAQADAASSGQVIIRSAEALIQQTQAKVAASAAGLKSE
ncbi:MAG: hypothetical protein PHY92_02510 [Alphaproteobacteria bacterium]|nr:hypothetical protein [Alphaproteobacteria bacterium]